jgi:SAM-dependent methyltransferase
VTTARYDGHADWYDSTFRRYGEDSGSPGLLRRLLGPADAPDAVCLDLGCGTGLHFRAIRECGYAVLGVDLSADQLRVAATRGDAFVGASVDRTRETELGEVRVTWGYGDERLHRDPTGQFPVRSRVGARSLTLGTFLGAFLDQPRLRVTSVREFDTAMRPWRVPADDGRIVPWNIAVTATTGHGASGK